MNSRLKQICQPRKILIFAFSLFLIVLLQLFVDDWQVKIFGFFLVLVIDNILLCRFTDYCIETGIFTVPSYNLISNLMMDFLVYSAIRYAHSATPAFDVIGILILFHCSCK